MTDLAKRVAGPIAIPTGATTFYTVPASTQCILRQMRIANTTASPITFKLSIGADAPGKRLYSDLVVPANDVYVASIFEVLEAAETLQGQAPSGGLTLTVSGVEVS